MHSQNPIPMDPEEVLGNLSKLRKRMVIWGNAVKRQSKERPGRSIAIAVGAGFLLGGGLFSPVAARILATGLKAGLKLALVPFLAQSLAVVAERSLFSDDSANVAGNAGNNDS